MATVNAVQDLEELAGPIKPGKPLVFLGLHRGWSWSLSDADDYKEGEPAYWNWAGGQPIAQHCGNIGSTGEWFATNCSSRLNFSCDNSKKMTHLYIFSFVIWYSAVLSLFTNVILLAKILISMAAG